jgi:hypothetical protein
VTYIGASHNLPRQEVFNSSHGDVSSNSVQNLELRILTPAFYARFMHYSRDLEAFTTEGLCTEDENRTLWISKPDLLPWLCSEPKKNFPRQQFRGWVDRLRWIALCNLRRPPPPLNYSSPTSKDASTPQDIRTFPLSPLDHFVFKSQTQADVYRYRRAIKEVFVAERVAFGMSGLLRVYDLAIQFCLAWFSALHGPRQGHSVEQILVALVTCNGPMIWIMLIELLRG